MHAALRTSLLALLLSTLSATVARPLAQRAASSPPPPPPSPTDALERGAVWDDEYLLKPTSELISYFPRIVSPVKDQQWTEGQTVQIAW